MKKYIILTSICMFSLAHSPVYSMVHPESDGSESDSATSHASYRDPSADECVQFLCEELDEYMQQTRGESEEPENLALYGKAARALLDLLPPSTFENAVNNITFYMNCLDSLWEQRMEFLTTIPEIVRRKHEALAAVLTASSTIEGDAIRHIACSMEYGPPTIAHLFEALFEISDPQRREKVAQILRSVHFPDLDTATGDDFTDARLFARMTKAFGGMGKKKFKNLYRRVRKKTEHFGKAGQPWRKGYHWLLKKANTIPQR